MSDPVKPQTTHDAIMAFADEMNRRGFRGVIVGLVKGRGRDMETITMDLGDTDGLPARMAEVIDGEPDTEDWT